MVRWDYDRHEILADGIVHGLGIVGGLVGVTLLLVLAAPTVGPWELTAVAIYGSGLLAVLGISAVYNLWPVSPVKWILRRFDHSAIYLLIAGTYTPFITQMRNDVTAILLLVGVWTGSVAGMALKLCLPGRYDRLAILLYLLLGWSGVMAYEAVLGALPVSALWLLAAGGALYTVGWSFTSGTACVSRTRSGTPSCLSPRPVTMAPCWSAWCWPAVDPSRGDIGRPRPPP